MSKQEQAGDGQEQGTHRSGLGWLAVALVVVFAITLVVLLVLHLNRQAEFRAAVADRQARNEELGLPRDFPLDVVPIYAGLEIIETERDSAKSNLGEPLDYWYVHGLSDDGKESIYDFYHGHFMGRGMHQQQYIGIPTGYGADYAGGDYLINLVIETRPPEERMQVELKVYRVR